MPATKYFLSKPRYTSSSVSNMAFPVFLFGTNPECPRLRNILSGKNLVELIKYTQIICQMKGEAKLI